MNRWVFLFFRIYCLIFCKIPIFSKLLRIILVNFLVLRKEVKYSPMTNYFKYEMLAKGGK